MIVKINFSSEIYLEGDTLAEIIKKWQECDIFSADALEDGCAEVVGLNDAEDTETHEKYFLANAKVTCYRPMLKIDEETCMDNAELISGYTCNVFTSREDCEAWLIDNGYNLEDCLIKEVEIHSDDMSNYTLLDARGEEIQQW